MDEAFVFGSWAARYRGQVGPPPRDIDVVVIGTASLRDVRRACADVEAGLRVEVNPVVVDPATWTARDPDPFISHVRNEPPVVIPRGRD